MTGCSAEAARGLTNGKLYEHLECILVHSKARGPEPIGQRDGGCTHCPTVGEGGVSERLVLCREITWCRARGGEPRRTPDRGVR